MGLVCLHAAEQPLGLDERMHHRLRLRRHPSRRACQRERWRGRHSSSSRAGIVLTSFYPERSCRWWVTWRASVSTTRTSFDAKRVPRRLHYEGAHATAPSAAAAPFSTRVRITGPEPTTPYNSVGTLVLSEEVDRRPAHRSSGRAITRCNFFNVVAGRWDSASR